MMKIGRSISLLAALALGGVAISGCTSSQTEKVDEPSAGQSASEQSIEQSGAEVAQSAMSEDNAIVADATQVGSPETIVTAANTAQALVEGAVVVEVEQERRGDRLEVKLYTPQGSAFKVLLSADGKEVINGPVEKTTDDHSRAKHVQRLELMQIDLEEFLRIFEAEFPGSTIYEVELDLEDGVLVWEIEFLDNDGNKVEAQYDAVSGELLQSGSYH